MDRSFNRTASLVGAAIFAIHAASAAEPASSPELSIYDRIWQHAELYNNPDNPVIQSIAFTGRYQLDYAVLDRDDFDHFGTRRWRMGSKMKLFGDFTLHSEVELDPHEDPWYQRFTEANLSWSRSKAFKFTVGKHGAPFTLDGMTSSKELLTIDRSNLGNNIWFPQEYIPGVSGSGGIDNWRYLLGVFSSGSANKEFGNFAGGYFILTTLGYDFAKALNVKQALLSANYVFQDSHPNNTFTRSLEHIGSLNFQFDTDKWGFRSDLSAAKGALGQSDIWGGMLMPYYNITRKLQVVSRYTYISSAEDNGVRFARYENFVISGRGDKYHEIYGGLNYYFYGHKLKVQTGVQHVEMKDGATDGGAYRGWAWTTGVRVSW
jgi:phosphate-selective porin OprO and OprP